MRQLAIIALLGCGPAADPQPESAAAEVAATPPAPAPADPLPTTPTDALVHETEAGTLAVHPVEHATLYLTLGEAVVWVDPVGELAAHPKADAVLITDTHADHLDADALVAVRGSETMVIAPQAVADELGAEKVDTVLVNGASTEVLGITVTAVPMYNHTRGPEPGKLFHDKGRGNGYLLEVGGKTVYIAGDTACTDEMKALEGIDHAFVPMNLPYTMPPEEAAECVRAFAPARVTPYHYRGSDLDAFRKGLAGTEIALVQVDFYPSGEPIP